MNIFNSFYDPVHKQGVGDEHSFVLEEGDPDDLPDVEILRIKTMDKTSRRRRWRRINKVALTDVLEDLFIGWNFYGAHGSRSKEQLRG